MRALCGAKVGFQLRSFHRKSVIFNHFISLGVKAVKYVLRLAVVVFFIWKGFFLGVSNRFISLTCVRIWVVWLFAVCIGVFVLLGGGKFIWQVKNFKLKRCSPKSKHLEWHWGTNQRYIWEAAGVFPPWRWRRRLCRSCNANNPKLRSRTSRRIVVSSFLPPWHWVTVDSAVVRLSVSGFRWFFVDLQNVVR